MPPSHARLASIDDKVQGCVLGLAGRLPRCEPLLNHMPIECGYDGLVCSHSAAGRSALVDSRMNTAGRKCNRDMREGGLGGQVEEKAKLRGGQETKETLPAQGNEEKGKKRCRWIGGTSV